MKGVQKYWSHLLCLKVLLFEIQSEFWSIHSFLHKLAWHYGPEWIWSLGNLVKEMPFLGVDLTPKLEQ